MPTIQDVAKRAGVAPITVSRVVNHSGYASEETRRRVETAVQELGYVPNTLARGLRSKRTHTLALVMTDITNPFFTLMARGVEDAASEAGFTVIFCNSDESETKEEKYVNILVQKQVDGILLIPACSNSKSVKFLHSNEIPVVLIDRSIPNLQTDLVRCNSEEGAYNLIKYLIGLGHKNIATITGPRSVSTSEDRVSGYQRAISEAGYEGFENIFYGSFTQASGYELTQQALALAARPTALFGTNNFISIGVLKTLREANIGVPEDIAVVGFDDLPDSMVVDPFLTVAAQPAYEMGQQATELLLKRLSGDLPQDHQEIILPTEIIVRES
ncbi:MAG TPA: LacI family transcriptional regulator, partial [Chloroflexi bacterium]|nr:LacI family transcriptional regulator [Chloroflexota bacterium]